MEEMEAEYAFYKGEEILDIGTIKELAEKFNLKIATMYYYCSETYRKRLANRKTRKARILVRLELDEDDMQM